jgi:hypothetical protein
MIITGIGYEHDLKAWKVIVSALRLTGFDHAISLEDEGGRMSFYVGKKSLSCFSCSGYIGKHQRNVLGVRSTEQN